MLRISSAPKLDQLPYGDDRTFAKKLDKLQGKFTRSTTAARFPTMKAKEP